MDDTRNQITAVTLDDRLHAYENQWVALNDAYEVIGNAERLTDLVEHLSSSGDMPEPMFLQVLPHDRSFISGAL